MNADELSAELGQPGAQQLLHHAELARLAYIGPDGAPRVIPIGFWWDEEQVTVVTASTAPKVKALSARPEVALTIDGASSPGQATSLQMRGAVTIEIVDGVASEYLAAAGKSMQGDELRVFEDNVRDFYEQTARISVTPRWARFYAYSEGRVPRFMRELGSR